MIPTILELCSGRGDHRREVSEVRGDDRDLGRDHDPMIVDRGLRVVAL